MELPTHDQLDKLYLKAGTEFTLDGVHCVYVPSDYHLSDFLEDEFAPENERIREIAGPVCWACPRVHTRAAGVFDDYKDSPACSPCHAVSPSLTIVPFVVWQRFQLLKD